MSAIAAFYVFAPENLEDLLEASDARRFSSFLESYATAQADFGYSGYVFNDRDLILAPEDASLFGSMGLRAESERLSAALGTSLALFDFDSARALRSRLKAITLTSKAVAEHLESEHGSADPTHVAAVQAALVQAREWLGQVQPGSIGLLTIG